MTLLKNQLRGRAFLLSASVPSPDRAERYRRDPGAAERIDQAVVAFARAVFAQGGSLVFGGAPSISPMIAAVASEYQQFAVITADGAMPFVRIHQSRAFDGHLPRETLLLESLGLARLCWSEAVAGEAFDPSLRHKAQCPLSLSAMRAEMVMQPDIVAMVAIGGMEGVEEELQLFRQHRLRDALPDQRPGLYGLQSCEGATVLASQDRDDTGKQAIRFIDTEVMAQLRDLDPEFGSGLNFELPYPLIMQTITEQYAHT